MNKIKLACILSFLVFGITLLFLDERFLPTVESNSNGPSIGRTGAPGTPPETNCTACHTDNPGPGIFSITAPTNYVPGQGYLIQVQHATTDASKLRWGFELTALDGLNTAAGIFANNTSFTKTIFGTVSGGTRYYAEHNLAGTFAGTSGGAGWAFDWTAPATNVGPITFYAAGNQANNDNTRNGDHLLTATAVSQPAGPACSGDVWTPTSSSTPPAARAWHTSVWTGTEMIVWGGSENLGHSNTGARYNPVTDAWTAMSTTNAPTARTYHTAVWTGTEMIVWGGLSLAGDQNTGGRYNPSTDTWTPITTTNAPPAIQAPESVWTGSEMLVWGGGNGGPSGQVNTGGRYNPITDTWVTITTTNAPVARMSHTAVWTGTEMIVWGGSNNTLGSQNTGGRYNPVTDTWTATTTTGAPSARQDHSAVWTGTEMIIWGIFGLQTGGRYNPATNSWTATATSGAPVARTNHSAIWTGSEMIVWGGVNGTIYRDTGGRYNPSTNSWTATPATGAPSLRARHTAVWTGTEMIVWGGETSGGRLDTGARYCAPPPPAPTATATYTPTNTSTPTNTATATNTPTSTLTATNTPANTPTNPPTATSTSTPFDCMTTMYASATNNAYFTVNISTGAATSVGTLPLDTTTEIEYDPISGRAFAQAGATGYVGTEFDVATGAAIGGQINNNHTFTGLEWIGTTLYGASIEGPSGPSTLRILDPWTGVSTAIGDTGVGPISGLAYDQSTGTMYGVTGSGASLYTIDLTTGTATLIGPTSLTLGSLEFGPDGNLYAGGGSGNAGNLYTINPSTGAATLVGNTGFGNISGLMNVCAQTSTPTNTPTDTPTATPTANETPSISGVITYGNPIATGTPTPRPVRNVSLSSTVGSPAVGPVITGTPGAYTLTGFGSGSYTIKPTKPGGANTSISSFDAARVAQGVSGAVPFVTLNQKFASDASGNGTVSSQDAARIAQFAAGLPTPTPPQFNLSGQWRFFTADLPGPPTAPLPTPPYNDSRSYPAGVTSNLTGEDYVAILIGEASGNYTPGTHARPVLGPERMVSVSMPNVVASAERELVIPVIVDGAVGKDIVAYEFDLRYDSSVIQPLAEPVNVKGTASRGLSVVANPYEPGLLRVVLYGAYPIDNDGVLLNLRFISIGKSGSVSPLTFERIMFNEGEPAAAWCDGQAQLF